MQKAIDNVIISEGNRPLWQTILAAVFYTLTVCSIFYGMISLAVLSFMLGLRFSVVNNIYFDFKKRLYKKELAVGMIKMGKWEHLPNIEYVCIFSQGWTKDSNGDGYSDSFGQIRC